MATSTGANDENSMFALCGKIYDEEKNIYIDADTTSVMECCLNQCTLPITSCHNHCKKACNVQSCLDNCQDQVDACMSKCKLSSPIWGTADPYTRCAKEGGCTYYGETINRRCAIDNHVKLHDCCMTGCANTSGTDCKAHCDLAANIVEGKSLSHGYPSIEEDTISYNKYNDQTPQCVLIGGIIGITVALFVYLKLWIKK